MRIKVCGRVYVTNLPGGFRQQVEERLSFENPRFLDNAKMGRWQGDTPEYLRCYEKMGDGLLLPRGFVRQLIGMARRVGVPFEIEDHRRSLPEVDFCFRGELRPYQQEAVERMLNRDFGTLAAPTGSGKTVVGLALVAERRQPTLIVTHTKELAAQWVDRIETFLGIPAAEVGRIGSGKRTVGEKITVALVQSLYKCADEVAPHIGHLVIDECHRTPSRTFTEAVSGFDSQYMLGLSATPWRRDKLSKLIFWYVGDVHHTIEQTPLIETGDILEADVIVRDTDFMPMSDPTLAYSAMLSELTANRARNLLIAEDVAEAAQNGGGVCLVLSDRKSHCEAIRGCLLDLGVDSELLTGDLGGQERARVVRDLNAGGVKVLVATGQLIGEGFDCRDLSTLFLATPIRFDGRVLQYLGRVLRPAPGKTRARVFDYRDARVPVLVASARARQKVYGKDREAA